MAAGAGEFRVGGGARWHGEGAARMEAAAGGEGEGGWHGAGDGGQRFAGAAVGGHGVEQRLRVGMARIAEDLLHRARLHDFAGVHHGDARACVPDDTHVVRDEQQRRLVALGLAHQLEHLRLDRCVERGRRLVRDDEPRIRHQHRGDHDALLLAAGEAERVFAEAPRGILDAGPREPVGGQGERIAPRHRTVEADGLDELVADLVERRERGHGVLEDHADR